MRTTTHRFMCIPALRPLAFCLLAFAATSIVAPLTVAGTQTKLTAADAEMFDNFGVAVAISGDTAVIGASSEDDAGFNAGAAYVFVRSGSSWTQLTKLTAADAAPGDQFGFSVALDGDTAVIGAVGDDLGGSTDAGSAYVFVRTGTTWTQQAKLTAADSDTNDRFGVTVALDGDTLIVGARFDADAGADSGSAYVFIRIGTFWVQQSKLTASDAAAGDEFGDSVAISGDTAVVGSPNDDDAGADSGSAYVFVRTGSVWTQQAKLTADDAAAGDEFGDSVAIAGDTAIVGALRDDDQGADSGSVYAFVRTGSSWTQQAKLTPDDAAAGDNFGLSVAVTGDTAIVGSPRDDDAGSNSGSAYIFTRSDSTWTPQAKLTADDGAAGDGFGGAVAISGDTAIVGAPFDSDAGAASGSAYVFDLASAPCPGDTNGDSIVDFSDLNAVLATFGQSGPGLTGDVNGDGLVNFTDLNAVLLAFGTNCLD